MASELGPERESTAGRRASTDAHPPDRPASGQSRLDISNRIGRLYKECYGKGPLEARTTISHNHVVCVVEGGYNKAEKTLIKHGRGTAVVDQRSVLQGVLRERFVAVIEDTLGRKVRSHMSASDPEAELHCDVFVLEP